MTTKTYRALKPFAHQYIHCDAGATIKLSDEQAEFLRHGGFIELIAPVDAAPVAAPVETASDTDAEQVENRRRKGVRA